MVGCVWNRSLRLSSVWTLVYWLRIFFGNLTLICFWWFSTHVLCHHKVEYNISTATYDWGKQLRGTSMSSEQLFPPWCLNLACCETDFLKKSLLLTRTRWAVLATEFIVSRCRSRTNPLYLLCSWDETSDVATVVLITESSVVKLSPMCFVEPYNYTQQDITADMLQQFNNYLRDQTSETSLTVTVQSLMLPEVRF